MARRYISTCCGTIDLHPQYMGRVRYTYADGTEFETTGTGSTLTLAEASQIPENKIRGLLTIEVGTEITTIGANAFLASPRGGGGNSTEFSAFEGDLVLNDDIVDISLGVFGGWINFNKPLILPNSLVTVGSNAFSNWRMYDLDFVFNHTDTIPTFNNVYGLIWNNWKSYFPARITIPNMSGKTNSDWKTAIGDINYNNGDIESINGVLWVDIP